MEGEGARWRETSGWKGKSNNIQEDIKRINSFFFFFNDFGVCTNKNINKKTKLRILIILNKTLLIKTTEIIF